MSAPSSVPAITAMITARILFQLNFVMTRLVNHAANTAAKIAPAPWQTSETPMAIVPCLSFAPLSTSICVKTDRIPKMISRIKVNAAEIMAGFLLGILSQKGSLEIYLVQVSSQSLTHITFLSDLNSYSLLCDWQVQPSYLPLRLLRPQLYSYILQICAPTDFVTEHLRQKRSFERQFAH